MTNYRNQNSPMILNYQRPLIPGMPLTLKPVLVALSYLLLLLSLSPGHLMIEAPLETGLWFPAAALHLLLLVTCGLRYIPVVFIGTVLNSFLIESPEASLLFILLSAIIATTGYSLMTMVGRDIIRINLNLEHIQDVTGLVLILGSGSLLIALLSGLGEAVLTPAVWPRLSRLVFDTWLSETIGLMTVLPFFLINLLPRLRALRRSRGQPPPKSAEQRGRWPAPSRLLEIFGQALSIFLILYIVFALKTEIQTSLLYLCFLPLIWITVRHGLPGATANIVTTNLGILLMLRFFNPAVGSGTELKIFMVTLALTGLFLGVVVTHHKRTLAALRVRDRAMAATYNGITIADAQQPGMPIIYANTGFEQITGYTEAEIIGQNCRFLQGVDTSPVAVEQIRHALGHAEACRVILKNYRKDGSAFWNELTIAPVHDEVGRLSHFVGIQSDITDRKQAEEALRDSFRRIEHIKHEWEATADSLSELFCLLNKAGRIVRANKTAERWQLRPVSQVAGLNLHELLHPGATCGTGCYLTQFWREAWAAVKQGQPAELEVQDHILGRSLHLQVRPIAGRSAGYSTKIAAENESVAVVVIGDITKRKRIEAALRDSEARFRRVISSISDHIYVSDRDDTGRHHNPYFSPHVEALTGYPQALFEADWNFWPSTVIYPADREKAAAQAEQLALGRDSEVEYRLVRADGEIIWVRDSGRAEREGDRVHIFGVVSDITDRKALEETWRRYEFIANTSKDSMTLINKNHRYEAVNEAFCRAVERERADIIGRHVSAVWGQARYRERIKKNLEWCLTGEEVAYQEWFEVPARGRRYFDVTYYPYRAKSGDVTHAVIIFRDITQSREAEETLKQTVEKLKLAYEHATTYAQDLHQEITEREHVEEALRQSEERIRSVVDNVVDGIITVDEHNIIESVNAAAEKVFGYAAAEIVGQPFELLIATDDRDDPLNWFDHLTQSREMVGRRKEGGKFPMDLAVSEFYLGERRMFIGIVRDITERKHLERQLRQAQKMEAIGQLAGGVAHDFNNILTVIGGHTELLLRRHDDWQDPQREDIELIKKASDRAANLTRQLLAFSRQQTLRPQLLSLNRVVTNFKEMLPRLLGEDIVLTTALAPDLGCVKADPGQIEQVLMNLAVNARDAMPRGGQMRIETGNVDLDQTRSEPDEPELKIAAGAYVMLTVSDSGVGMDSATQNRIFDPFFTTKEQGKGTGLGLSTVYGIVRQSDGYIWVDSQPGRGTTFKICLPRVIEAVALPPGEREPPRNQDAKSGTETVLLVEDESSVRLITRRFLQKQNYNVLEASHPEEALEICDRYEGHIDLLITDLIMPYMNGHELAEKLSKSYPDLKILYISGYADDTLNSQGILDPDILFLEKPFSSEALAHKVREALEAG